MLPHLMIFNLLVYHLNLNEFYFCRYSRARLVPNKNRIGSVYTKAIYRAFTDATFTTPLPVPEWAGMLGPPIRAEVGDVVFIHFKNMASGSSFSVHPHGFLYDKANEGTCIYAHPKFLIGQRYDMYSFPVSQA